MMPSHREEGLRQLFLTMPQPLGTGRYYSDMHAMVLKYVVEGAAGESLFDCLSRRILRPLGMRNTFAHGAPGGTPPGRLLRPGAPRRGHAAHPAPGHRSGYGSRPQGTAALPGWGGPVRSRGAVCHPGDMVRFCQGVLRGQVLSRESLRFLAQNRTGRPLPEGGYTQYLGCQCYVKHPDQFFSEIPVYMGSRPLGSAASRGITWPLTRSGDCSACSWGTGC